MKRKRYFLYLCIWFSIASQMIRAQEILEYTVMKTATPIVVDGVLDEDAWVKALPTEYFVEQEHGDSVPHATQAKLLWDSNYLYVGFICEDPDVWSTYTDRDAHLWEEENVEIFGDPDGDEKNYFEMEFNPLGTIFDQVVDHSWLEGENHEDRSWNLGGLKVGVSVQGTINNVSDEDTAWYCEVAIPFDSLDASILPSQAVPSPGGSWRIQLARYNRQRDANGNVLGDPETSMWNMTGTPWFHVPEKFGRIIFSDEKVTAIGDHSKIETLRWKINPNPIKDFATIEIILEKESRLGIGVFNITGQKVFGFPERMYGAGCHTLEWHIQRLEPGIYICKIHYGREYEVKKVMLIK